LRTKLYNRRDDFNFPILNSPLKYSNIPTAPVCRVYISQLIRYTRVCASYQHFRDRGLLLIMVPSGEVSHYFKGFIVVMTL